MMTRLTQKSLEDTGSPQPKADGEYYYPTESEKARGRWVVVFELLDNDGVPDMGSAAHIIPIFDKKFHLISAECWCAPKIRVKSKEAWTHNSSQ